MLCSLLCCMPCVSNGIKTWCEGKEIIALVHLEAYEEVKTWATLFLPVRVNPHKSALLLDVLWLTQLPQLRSTSGLLSIKHQINTMMLLLSDSFWKELVNSAEPNQCFPWLNKNNWEQAPKCGGISGAGWIPAAPDCACSLRRAPWWAVAAMVLFPNPCVSNVCDSCVPGVCRGSWTRTRVSAALQQDTIWLSYCYGRICLSASFTCTWLFLTHTANPCLWDSEPKNVSAFFFQAFPTVPTWGAT